MNQRKRPQGYAANSLASRETFISRGIRKILLRTNCRALGSVSRRVGILFSKTTGNRLPLGLRVMISLTQPIDPLARTTTLPEIELVVPFVEKDLRTLPLVLSQAKRMVRNPIGRIVLITPRIKSGPEPRFESENSKKILESLLASHSNSVLKFDQDILGSAILEELESRFGKGDRNSGWVTQQLIKISAALTSERQASLVIDADTLLLSRKTWLAENGRQLLQISNEYHSGFMRHLQRFFGVEKKLRVSFITHHQLMQKEVLEQMFPDGAKSLLRWWRESAEPSGRDLGDYEAYGSFLLDRFPERVEFGSFGNLLSPHLQRFLEDLEKSQCAPESLVDSYCSISFHSWAQQK